MPSVEDMAKAYTEQIVQKIVDLEKQVSVLRSHLEECEGELGINKENEDD